MIWKSLLLVLVGVWGAVAFPSHGIADTPVKTVTGEGMQTTRPFTVDTRWELQWKGSDVIISITVKDESDRMVSVSGGSTEGSSYHPTGGTYHLVVNALGEWTITIVQVD